MIIVGPSCRWGTRGRGGNAIFPIGHLKDAFAARAFPLPAQPPAATVARWAASAPAPWPR
eukprot:3098210-Lingulodinium_polyedra.AAC.1